jgi:hypothetical protein
MCMSLVLPLHYWIGHQKKPKIISSYKTPRSEALSWFCATDFKGDSNKNSMNTKQSLSFSAQSILLRIDCAYSFRTGGILEPAQIQAILENKHPSD